MRLLLDTHVFLRYITSDDRLPSHWIDGICDQGNEVYLSVVSLWESIVKYHLGKLPLPLPPGDYLPSQRDRHNIASLNLDESSVCRLSSLPAAHNDPFDRMLVCQAMQHSLTIVTADHVFEKYPAPVLARNS
jgi:PIN domain nuclease of toxin-antitoxin system